MSVKCIRMTAKVNPGAAVKANTAQVWAVQLAP